MLGSTVGLAVTLLVRSAASLVSGGVVDVVACIVVSGTSEETACEEERGGGGGGGEGTGDPGMNLDLYGDSPGAQKKQ